MPLAHGVVGAVDLAHPTDADQRLQLVRPELGAQAGTDVRGAHVRTFQPFDVSQRLCGSPAALTGCPHRAVLNPLHVAGSIAMTPKSKQRKLIAQGPRLHAKHHSALGDGPRRHTAFVCCSNCRTSATVGCSS